MPLHPYPVNLNVCGQPVLVVGGGRIAASKVAGLTHAGARVTVIAPTAVPAITHDQRIEWRQRRYEEGEVAKYRLAVVATNDPMLNSQVYKDADKAGVWINSADDPTHCTFTLPAVSLHGDLQLTVSTNGRSPAVAAWIRSLLDRWIRPEHTQVLALASEVRKELRAVTGSSESSGWRDALDDKLLEMVRIDRIDLARERIRRAVGLSTFERKEAQ